MISYTRLNFFCAECGRDKGKSEFKCLLWTFPYHFTSELSREPWVERTLRCLMSDPLANRQDKIIEKGKDNYNGVQQLKTQDTTYQSM